MYCTSLQRSHQLRMQLAQPADLGPKHRNAPPSSLRGRRLHSTSSLPSPRKPTGAPSASLSGALVAIERTFFGAQRWRTLFPCCCVATVP